MEFVNPTAAAIGVALSSIVEFGPVIISWVANLLNLKFPADPFESWTQRQKVGFWLAVTFAVSVGLFLNANPGVTFSALFASADWLEVVKTLALNTILAFVGSQAGHLVINKPAWKLIG